MIAFRAAGGLGNQLFQYAVARALALRQGTGVVIDPGWFAASVHKRTPRTLDLLGCRIDARLATPDETARFARLAGPLRSRLPFGRPWRPLRERHLDFHPELFDAPDRTYLIGYWQSWRYFESIRPRLLEETMPAATPDPADVALGERIAASESIAVHVRRGDYVSDPTTAAHHGSCAADYYSDAVASIAEGLADPVAFVFSDDPAWVRANLRLPVRHEVIDRHSPAAALADLTLMRHCRHFVIANSSFSWWGAWLGVDPEKRVAAPAQWFASGRPMPDLLPPGWQAR